jgi:hypothetical protein
MKPFRTTDALNRSCVALIDHALHLRKRSRETCEKGQHLVRHSQQLLQDIIFIEQHRKQLLSQARQVRALNLALWEMNRSRLRRRRGGGNQDNARKASKSVAYV